MEIALFGIAASIFAASAYTDLKSRRIDNRLVLALAALAALRAVLFASPETALLSALGGIVVGALLLPMFLRGWIGGGDLKLIVAGCWFFGISDMPSFLLAVALSGGALALLELARRLGGARTASAAPAGDMSVAETTLPYALAIAGGGWWTMLVLLLQQ